MRPAAAGLATACRRALTTTRGRVTGARVVVLAGPGNNGGDALFAAANLAHRGAHVTVAAPLGRLHEEGWRAARRAGARLLDGAPDTAADTAPDTAAEAAVAEAVAAAPPSRPPPTSSSTDCGHGRPPAPRATAEHAHRLVAESGSPPVSPAGSTSHGTSTSHGPPPPTAPPRSSSRSTSPPVSTPRRGSAGTSTCAPTSPSRSAGGRRASTCPAGRRRAGASSSSTSAWTSAPPMTLGNLTKVSPPTTATRPRRRRPCRPRLCRPRPRGPAVWVVDDVDLRDWPRPGPHDHKYMRGVLGVIAGSQQFPGAGVLTEPRRGECRGRHAAGAGRSDGAGRGRGSRARGRDRPRPSPGVDDGLGCSRAPRHDGVPQ